MENECVVSGYVYSYCGFGWDCGEGAPNELNAHTLISGGEKSQAAEEQDTDPEHTEIVGRTGACSQEKLPSRGSQTSGADVDVRGVRAGVDYFNRELQRARRPQCRGWDGYIDDG